MIDDLEDAGYRWESEYEKTWEILKENEEGLLQPSVEQFVQRSKRRKHVDKRNYKLGMTRHMYVVLDMSSPMNIQDIKPTRHICALKVLESFVEDYFDQNPISQLGLIVTKNKRAEKVVELCGLPKPHQEAFQKLALAPCIGEPSLQNSLELAAKTLKNLPAHISREVLVIFGSLTTCDPRDIHTTIKELKALNIRVSIIGLAAELFICKLLARETKGTYEVILDDIHLKESVMQHISPPLALPNQECSLIKTGFPNYQEDAKPSMCYCHLDTKNPGEGWTSTGFFCPQCNSKYCSLPVECKVCNLTLVSASHLARSYHHLFPIDPYEEVPKDAIVPEGDKGICYGCQSDLKEQMVYQCPQCLRIFCLECDLFIHDLLHTCPGCSNKPST